MSEEEKKEGVDTPVSHETPKETPAPTEPKKDDQQKQQENASRDKKDESKKEEDEPRRAVISPQEVEDIKNTAERFWREHGLAEEVEDWTKYPDGKKLIIHFQEKSKGNEDLFRGCQSYFDCLSKYQQAKGNKQDYSFDESKVDYARVKNEMDIAFFLVVRDLPTFLLSERNLHTRNWVISQVDASTPYKTIFETAAKKAKEQHDNKLAAEWAEKEEELNERNQLREIFGMEKIDIGQKKQEWEEEKSAGRFGFIVRYYGKYAAKHKDEILAENGNGSQQRTGGVEHSDNTQTQTGESVAEMGDA